MSDFTRVRDKQISLSRVVQACIRATASSDDREVADAIAETLVRERWVRV